MKFSILPPPTHTLRKIKIKSRLVKEYDILTAFGRETCVPPEVFFKCMKTNPTVGFRYYLLLLHAITILSLHLFVVLTSIFL